MTSSKNCLFLRAALVDPVQLRMTLEHWKYIGKVKTPPCTASQPRTFEQVNFLFGRFSGKCTSAPQTDAKQVPQSHHVQPEPAGDGGLVPPHACSDVAQGAQAPPIGVIIE